MNRVMHYKGYKLYRDWTPQGGYVVWVYPYGDNNTESGNIFVGNSFAQCLLRARRAIKAR